MATFLTILSGEDLRDFGSIPPEHRRYENADPAQLKGMEIGLCLDAGFGCETEPEIREAILNVAREVEAAGAVIVPVDRLIEFDPSEALNKLFFLRSRLEYNAMPAEKRSLMLPYALQACELAGQISAINYASALEELEKAKAQMYRHFSRLHYMLTPASPVHGFPADDVGADTKSALRHTNFMSLVNQTGQPGAVVNCGTTAQNLPIGIQVIGRRFDDWGVVQLLAALETMLGATPDIAEPN
jgi:Asp-tRNA(Asn)/Glu-tRNA(Gln) amidotransferase A subunit family amidase